VVEKKLPGVASPLPETVGRKERRKLWARRKGARDVWFGFGLFGVVGWSVAVPTLAGAGLGWWLDSAWPGGRSWTLTLLIAGLAVGCAIAWRWVAQELRIIDRTERSSDE